MKRFLLFILGVAACSVHLMAQNIRGKVADNENKPIEAVTVVMQSADSVYVDAAITDVNGDFTFNHNIEHYRLIFQHLLYETVSEEFKEDSAGVIIMKEKDYTLNEVVVKGERPLVKAVNGSLTYDVAVIAEKSAVSNAYDAITRLPGVMEQNGALNLLGAGEVTVILNGKPSSMTGEQLTNLLRNTPVSNVEKAEVMYSAPAKYRVRGAVINVELKRQKSENSFVRGEVGGTFTQGKYSRGKGDLNLSFVGEKLTADVLYSADYSKVKTAYDFISHHTVNGKVYDVDQYNDGSKRNMAHNIRTSLDYQIAENDNINMAYTAAISPNAKSVDNSKGSLSESSNITTGNEQMHNVNVDYTSNWGMNVGLDYTYYSYPRLQDFKNIAADGSKDNFLMNSNQNINRCNVYAGQNHSLVAGWNINYGINFSFANEKSSQVYKPKDGKDMSSLNTDTELGEKTYNFYGGFEKAFNERLSLSLSVAGEYYKLADYDKWAVYPSMQLSFIPSASHIFQLSFSSDKKYPDYWEMQDVTGYINGYSKVKGNPLLRPSSEYTANLTYVLMSKYIFNIYYTHEKDLFAQLAYQNPDELSMLYQTVNFDYEQNYGISAVIPFTVGNFWNSRITLDGSYFRDVCRKFHDISFDNSVWRGVAMMNNTFNISSKPSLSLELNGLYVSPSIQGIYDLTSIWKVDAGLKWTFADKNAELRFTANDIFNSAAPDATINYKGQNFKTLQHADSRYLSVSFTYKFGGFKSKEHKKVDVSRFGY